MSFPGRSGEYRSNVHVGELHWQNYDPSQCGHSTDPDVTPAPSLDIDVNHFESINRSDIEVAGTPGPTVGGGGAVFRRDSEGWSQEQTPVGDNLESALRGADFDSPRDIAVGAGGTAIETK